MISKTLRTMMEYFGTDRERVNHAIKVHSHARTIALGEGLDPERAEQLECAAAIHNIGVYESLRIFGSTKAEYRQAMGAKVAGELLRSLEFPDDFVERVVFLVAHQQSFEVDGGIQLQILFEAEAIAGLDEGAYNLSPLEVRERIFRTATGREMVNTLFGIPPNPPSPWE